MSDVKKEMPTRRQPRRFSNGAEYNKGWSDRQENSGFPSLRPSTSPATIRQLRPPIPCAAGGRRCREDAVAPEQGIQLDFVRLVAYGTSRTR
jgi:hypothetical protein